MRAATTRATQARISERSGLVASGRNGFVFMPVLYRTDALNYVYQ